VQAKGVQCYASPYDNMFCFSWSRNVFRIVLVYGPAVTHVKSRSELELKQCAESFISSSMWNSGRWATSHDHASTHTSSVCYGDRSDRDGERAQGDSAELSDHGFGGWSWCQKQGFQVWSKASHAFRGGAPMESRPSPPPNFTHCS